MSWRVARSITQLQKELNSRWPNRTRPDWTIGDAAHRSRASDHNPNSAGVVCAIDIRSGGIDLGALAEHIRRRNPRAVKYVIYNRKIWSKARSAEGWRTYSGSNPHTSHMHVSVGVGPDGRSTGPYDDTSSWGISSVGSSAPSSGSYETYKRGQRAGSRVIGQFSSKPWSAGDDVKEFQRIFSAWYPSRRLNQDGRFGPKTTEAARFLQGRVKITVDGFVGPQTWRAINVR